MKTKILKIIQIVYDILSLAFIAVVIASIALAPKSELNLRDNDVTEVVNKVRRNTAYTDEYGHQYYYNSSDFATSSTFEKLIQYLVNQSEAFSGFSTSSNGAPSTHWSISGNNSIASYIGYYDGSGSIVGVQDIKWISFNKNFLGVLEYPSTGGECFFSEYILSFYNNSNLIDSNCVLQVKMNYLVPSLGLSNHEVNGLLYFSYSINSFINSMYVTRGVYYENDLDGVCLFHDLIKLDSQTDYINQYNAGYNAGRRAGYDEGYIKGSSGIETNAFSVISQAFEAVGDIFSVQVLPNLPLWVLVFTPLIVAVVIVVVKLIKG